MIMKARPEETVEYVPHAVFSSYEAYQDHIRRTQPYIDEQRRLEELDEQLKKTSVKSAFCHKMNKLLKFFIIWD